MSQENVKAVARLVEAWNEVDVETMLALFDPECEVAFPPEVPEPGPFHGHDSIVAMLHQIGRGSGNRIEMDETDAHVFTFRGGRITRWRNFNERHEALEAAGLRE
jgi:ketosteroid isomerase-like protein